MRTIIDARELRTSTGRYIERLIHYLQKLDNKNEYVILVKPTDLAGFKPKNENFRAVACPYKEFTFSEQVGLLKQIKGLEPDLVHFAMTQQPVFYRGRTVTTVHDLTTARWRNPAKNWLVFTIKQAIYKWVIKRVVKKSVAILVPSKFVKDDLIKFTGNYEARINVTYEAAGEVGAATAAVESLKNKQFIFYIGRPLPHKNLRRLIDAYVLLKQKHPQLQLVLAGKRDKLYDQHQQYVKNKNVAGVMFTGFMSDAQLKWLYDNAAAYVFPSLSEGFGLPGLEAMANGCPLISSNATCLPEIYGDAAHYFEPENVSDMARAITEVLDDDKLRAELIEKGRRQAAKYSWAKTAKETLEIYRKARG